SSPYSDHEVRDALGVLDKQLSQNSAECRRHLHVHVRGSVIHSDAQIIRGFMEVSKRLDQVGSVLQLVNNLVNRMHDQNSAASVHNAPLLDEFSEMLTLRSEINGKNVLLETFIDYFTMSEENIIALTNSAELVDDKFFVALRQVKHIYSKCEVLLARGNDRVGKEIMDEMASHLNAAFQKLFRWVQKELKGLSLENSQVNVRIRRALRVLAERQVLFKNCMNFLVEARQKIILDSFIKALTGSATNPEFDKTIKPIEVYAHDPLRYIGDMLAWLHSAAVGEQEALEVLFSTNEGAEDTERSIYNGMKEGLKTEPWITETSVEELDIKSSLASLISRNLESVCKPLQSRAEQAIASEESSTLAYQMCNLIKFYHLTFDKLLQDGSLVVDTIKSIQGAAFRQFYNTMEDHLRNVELSLPSLPEGLAAPLFLLEILEDLQLLMKSHSTSLAPMNTRSTEFANIMQYALDPYLSLCDKLACRLSEIDKHVFSINCLLVAEKTLRSCEFTLPKVQKLEQIVNRHIGFLENLQYERFLQSSGIQPLVIAVSEQSSEVSPQLSFSSTQLQDISKRLDGFLPTALMNTRVELNQLNSLRIVDSIYHSVVVRFIKDFEKVEEAILVGMDKNLEENVQARDVWPRTTEEVRLLLN
ncbi:oligomeric Golgi complex subunit 6, partial [Geopyxis carbonaria]